VIGQKGVQVDSPGRDSFYVRRGRAAMADGLRRQFELRVNDSAKQILEEKRDKAPHRQELTRFQVPWIQVTADALVLAVDFTLAITNKTAAQARL
jgi:hypothetical protein